jgi:GRAB domain
MTNTLLHFLTLPREDTKRYEILGLMASILDWSDEQRQKAGLARAGGEAWRVNSTGSLGEVLASPGGERKEVCPC